ncbi:MAG: NAD(P)/FAD-dependent oxidoreductase, partial [Chloroflexota bacterium]|nr:NAD(P)/FAD-dependent oxidoreductase [Chloroflexota bacterium]
DDHLAVEVRTEKDSADRHTFTSRGLVLADGPHTLARTLGLGFEPRPADTAFALAYELAWPGNPMQHYEIYYGPQIARWGFAWVFPKRDHLNVGMGCSVRELRRGRDLKRDLNTFIQAHPIAAEMLRDKAVVRRRGGFIPMLEARCMYGPGVLVAGDAAGVVNPLFGSGIDNALLSGELAGRVMSQALERGDLSAQFLARYQREWENGKAHSFIAFQNRLTRLCRPFSRLDGNLLGKLLQIGFLGRSLSWAQKLRVLPYPLLGKPRGLKANPG